MQSVLPLVLWSGTPVARVAVDCSFALRMGRLGCDTGFSLRAGYIIHKLNIQLNISGLSNNVYDP
jgi:hypothetical protein